MVVHDPKPGQYFLSPIHCNYCQRFLIGSAKRIKQNLMISDQERQHISLATKAQSNYMYLPCHSWVRITASQSKLALMKPSTNPAKAMKEILHYNNQYQSNRIKQWLKDEKNIIWLYDNKLDSKVSETGFVTSQTVILSLEPLQMGR